MTWPLLEWFNAGLAVGGQPAISGSCQILFPFTGYPGLEGGTLDGGSDALDYLAVEYARDHGIGDHVPDVFDLQRPRPRDKSFPLT